MTLLTVQSKHAARTRHAANISEGTCLRCQVLLEVGLKVERMCTSQHTDEQPNSFMIRQKKNSSLLLDTPILKIIHWKKSTTARPDDHVSQTTAPSTPDLVTRLCHIELITNRSAEMRRSIIILEQKTVYFRLGYFTKDLGEDITKKYQVGLFLQPFRQKIWSTHSIQEYLAHAFTYQCS
ncbi:hypothetical protein TNCV_4508661 [Trichonephila clavipes]|nr:hypothetical protein TNCV_4508661 [Trichonephila clavipes]